MDLNAKFGIDLSSNNHGGEVGQAGTSNIDYNAVKNSNLVDFAYIKATQSDNYVNSWFGLDYNGLKAVGIPCGAYLFWDFSNPNIQAQVDWFASHYGWVDGDLIPMLDFEYNPTARSWDDIRTTCNQAQEEIMAKGYPKVGWYMNRNWEQNVRPSGVSLWLAEGEDEEPASIQQFGTKSIPGIQGQVDWNVA